MVLQCSAYRAFDFVGRGRVEEVVVEYRGLGDEDVQRADAATDDLQSYTHNVDDTCIL